MNRYSFCDRVSFEGMLGYSSKYDGQTIELDLCPACADKLIDECAVSPLVEDNLEDDSDLDIQDDE